MTGGLERQNKTMAFGYVCTTLLFKLSKSYVALFLDIIGQHALFGPYNRLRVKLRFPVNSMPPGRTLSRSRAAHLVVKVLYTSCQHSISDE